MDMTMEELNFWINASIEYLKDFQERANED